MRLEIMVEIPDLKEDDDLDHIMEDLHSQIELHVDSFGEDVVVLGIKESVVHL